MIMYLAALKSVPEQLYEAAAIDGASAMQKLLFVTLPMMRNIIAITVLFSLIVTFADFDIVRILTNGGPEDMTHVFATYAFQVGIQSGDIPLGAAVSLFMLPDSGGRGVFRAARRDPPHARRSGHERHHRRRGLHAPAPQVACTHNVAGRCGAATRR